MSLAYFPLFPDDFEADTAHLTLAEDGAYNRLLRLCWRTPGCSIPADRTWVYRRMRAASEADQAVVETVISEFFKEAAGRLSNARLSKEWLAANEAHQRRKSAGSKGGKSKALKTNETASSNATAKPKQPEPEPEPIVVELGSARAGANEFREQCFKAAGLDPQTAMAVPGLVSTVSLEHLIRDPANPCDPELDVLPAIETCAAGLRKRGQTLNNWSYCREAAIRNRDQRLAGNPAPVARTAAGTAPPARQQKHSGGGIPAAAIRVAAKLRESRGQYDDPVGGAEPVTGDELGGVFSNHRRIAGTG